MIPFVVTVIVLEELIPLIVLYAPFMLPSTCVLPSQRERIAAKAQEKQVLYYHALRPDFEVVRQQGNPDHFVPVNALSSTSSRALCG